MNFRFNPYKSGQSTLQAMDCRPASGSATMAEILDARTRTTLTPGAAGRTRRSRRDGHIYATTGMFNFNGIGRSTDGGKTWNVLQAKADPNAPEVKVGAGLPDLYSGGASEGIHALPDEPQVWAVLGGKLYSSADGGDTWSAVFRVPRPALDRRRPEKSKAVSMCPATKTCMSTDDGETFTPIGGPHQGGRIAVDSLGRVLVAARTGDHGGVWRWDGKTWTRLWDDG